MLSKEEATDFILEVLQNLTKHKFAFTVQIVGNAYDVYYFKGRGQQGTIALRMNEDGVVEVALFVAGKRSREEVTDRLTLETN